MSSPITEIVTIPGNDASKNNTNILTEVNFTQILAEKAKDSGLIEQLWGYRIEEPGTWQGLLNWPTIEHHKKVIPVLEADPELRTAFKAISGGPTHIIHVPFAPYDKYRKAIKAPLTEVIFTKMKDTSDVQEFKDFAEYALDTTGAAEGCVRGAWGFAVEDEKVAVFVIGWESHEAHLKYEATQAVKDSTAKFLKLGDIEKSVHIKFQ